VFKEERANLQYSRQSGAMFQDEKQPIYKPARELLSSSLHLHSTQSTTARLGSWFLCKSLQTTPFFPKQKTKDLCLVVEFLLQYKKIEQPANST